MERKDMIIRLNAGEKAIDLSIEKFEDMLNGTGHDLSAKNCACCYADGNNNCSTCSIYRYEVEQWRIFKTGDVNDDYDDAFEYNLCGNLPSETDKEGLKKAIEYLKGIKQWMIEKGEYEQNTIID